MRTKTFYPAVLPALLALTSCGALAAGESTVPAFGPGESIALEEELPFHVESYGAFNEPWAFDFDPVTGMILVTEKSGTMKFIDPANNEVGEVTGEIPEVYHSGQAGLGDVVFAPDYAESGMIYLSWAKPGDLRNSARPAVGRGTLSCTQGETGARTCSLDDFSVIWTQSMDVKRGRHLGHRIAFSPDGQHLYISSSDRGQDEEAQNNGNTLGTIVRLLPDGTPAPGNPFADQGSPSDEIWSFGHRNPLGLAFDTTGQLWDVEHGPRGGDELNKVEPGNNYGWPTRSYGNQYNGDAIADHSPDDGFVKPATFWTPVIAPGGMIFYSGDMFAAWKGDALIASLTDQSLIEVAVDAEAGSAREEKRYAFPNRLRDVAQSADGAVWLIEDGAEGRLLRVTARAEALAAAQ